MLIRTLPVNAHFKTMSSWYTLSLFFHLVGLALWLGGIASFLVIFGPAANDLQTGTGIRVLNHGRSSFEAASSGWGSGFY